MKVPKAEKHWFLAYLAVCNFSSPAPGSHCPSSSFAVTSCTHQPQTALCKPPRAPAFLQYPAHLAKYFPALPACSGAKTWPGGISDLPAPPLFCFSCCSALSSSLPQGQLLCQVAQFISASPISSEQPNTSCLFEHSAVQHQQPATSLPHYQKSQGPAELRGSNWCT